MSAFSFMRTPSVAAWHTKLNYMAAAIAMVNVVAFALVSMPKEYADIRLVYSRNHTIVHTSAKRFNVFAAFAAANVLVIASNIRTAARPSPNTLKTIYANNSFGRWGVMILTMPILHTACLLGIARVYDAWAAVCCATLVVLGILLMWTADEMTGASPLLGMLRPAVLFATYAMFWGFVWFTGDAHPLSIACLLLLVVGAAGFRAFFKGGKQRAPLYKEAVTVMTVCIVHAGPPWIWLVADSNEYSPMVLWSTFFSVVMLAVAISVWAILNVASLDIAAAADPTRVDGIATVLLVQPVHNIASSDDDEETSVL